MNRKVTGLVAAVTLALVGTLLLVGYVRTAEARALSGEELVDVLVVKDKIRAGTPVEEIADHVVTEAVPAKVRAQGALASLDDVKGKVAAVELVPGEQLVETRFSKSVARVSTGIPSGLHEVTISLDPERTVGGQVRAGDTVGVTGSLPKDGDAPAQTHMVLHKVLVTAVQIDHVPDDDEKDETGAVAPAGKLLITLAIDAPAVERVVYFAEHGSIWLSAEPLEAVETGTKVLTRASVFA